MKKKLLSLCLVLALGTTAVIGGTLAYFTDTDNETNTFTVGNVIIDLIEKQRGVDDDGNKILEDFTQGKKLYPIVGSAQGDKDEFGQPVAENYVDKIVTVENKGTEDAYIRAYFAIPSALDDGYDTFNAGLNVLHFNFGNVVDEDGDVDHTTYGEEWLWKQSNGKWNYFETTMSDGIKYNVYFADYYKPLAAGATTEQFVQGVYLDTTFNYEEIVNPDKSVTEQYFVMQKNKQTNQMEKKVLELETGWNWSSVQCPVFAVAVQAAGFDSADAAVTAAFGAQFNPWGATVTNWQ